MSIVVNWDNPDKTAIRWDFEGKWNWEQFIDAYILSDRMVASVEHTVDIISNLDRSAMLPEGALKGYENVLRNTSDNIGVIVLISASRFLNVMVSAFNNIPHRKTAGSNFAFAKTMSEARAILRARQRIQPVYGK
jgi:hypothetical protein